MFHFITWIRSPVAFWFRLVLSRLVPSRVSERASGPAAHDMGLEALLCLVEGGFVPNLENGMEFS